VPLQIEKCIFPTDSVEPKIAPPGSQLLTTMRKGRLLNWSSLVLVNLLWAGQFPAYKVASAHMDVVSLNLWIFVCASLLLAPFLLAERKRRVGPSVQVNRRKIVRQFLLLGTAGLVPPSVFLSWGIAHSTASNAAIISMVIPVLTALMAVVVLGERMTRLRWLSFSAAILGTILTSNIHWGGGFFQGSLLVGNAVVFCAWMGSAFYNTYSKKLLATFSELEVLIYGYVVACAVCALLSGISGGRPFYKPGGYPLAAWGAILVLGGLSWGLAMALWMWVLKRLDVSQISISIYLMPLFGVLLSALTLHERLTVAQLSGGALVLAATYLTADYETRREARKKPGVTAPAQ
jgi:drug/metabolite transporter (DMT)-like permease